MKKLTKMANSFFGLEGKKGNAVLGYAGVIVALFIIFIVVFAVATAGDSMQASLNSSSTGYTVISNMLSGVNSFAGLSSSIWVIAGVGLLLAVLLGGLGFLALRNRI